MCPVCNIYYISYSIYEEQKEKLDCVNIQAVPEIREQVLERKRYVRKALQKQEHQKYLEEQKRIKAQELEIKKVIEEQKSSELSRLRKEKGISSIKKNEYYWDQQNAEMLKASKQILSQKGNGISRKDFVIWGTIGKCRYKEHNLENIDAVIDVINKNGKIISEKVAAGYCPTCKVFFIMESVYQSLKGKGVLLCRVRDEKSYLKKGGDYNSSGLAEESILRQNGYTVAKKEGLAIIQRQAILASLVDYNILTRSAIICHLDWCILNKKSDYKNAEAIEKWEEDREFIAKYKIGEFTQYGVEALSRR